MKALTHQLKKSYTKAIELFEPFIDDNPEYPNNISQCFLDLSQFERALKSINQYVKINPGSIKGITVKADILLHTAEYEQVISLLNLHIQKQILWAEAFNILGLAQLRTHNLPEAIKSFQISKSLKDTPESNTNLGIAFYRAKDMKQSSVILLDVMQKYPSYVPAYIHYSLIMLEGGAPERALQIFKKGQEIEPKHDYLLALILSTARDLADLDTIRQFSVEEPLGTEHIPVPPLIMLPTQDNPKSHMLTAMSCAKHFKLNKISRTRITEKSKSETPITVAYIGYDFHDFPSMYLLRGVLAKHDRRKFRVVAISYGPKKDHMTEVIKTVVDEFLDISGSTTSEAVQAIRDIRPVIAIDISGYTKGGRPDLFVKRVAPYQISFLGYAGTLGAKFMDFILSDHFVTPQHTEQFFTANIIRFERTYFPFDDSQYRPTLTFGEEVDSSDSSPPFRFANLNRCQKHSLHDYEAWAEILQKSPNSSLTLYAKNKKAMANIRKFFNQQSISETRIYFFDYVQSRNSHFDRLTLLDLILDDFNYNGHTTTAEALWCGTPALTKPGKQMAARCSGSMLLAAGLPELISKNRDEFISNAVALSNSRANIQRIKKHLRSWTNVQNLFDTARYTAELESILMNLVTSRERI